MGRPTVSREWLLHEAMSIEKSAQESKDSWILLGQAERYYEAMERVSRLRVIADLPSIADRRERLRELGYAA